jgi:hypothetical protein
LAILLLVTERRSVFVMGGTQLTAYLFASLATE